MTKKQILKYLEKHTGLSKDDAVGPAGYVAASPEDVKRNYIYGIYDILCRPKETMKLVKKII